MPAKHKLAIFDLDGTLADTHECNFQAYRQSLEAFGFALNRETFMQNCIGKSWTEFLPELTNCHNLNLLKTIHDFKLQIYSAHLHHARLNQPLIALMADLTPKYHIALVTSASKKNSDELLSFFNLRQHFDLIITRDNVSSPKPSPEGFRTAINHFNIQDNHTIIFEDSDAGIQAAQQTDALLLTVSFPDNEDAQ